MDVDGFLPEPIIHHVLSFLPLRQVMKAALVCKSWNRACSSLPILHFDSSEFVGNVVDTGEVPARVILQLKVQRLERMMKFIDETMTRFQEKSLKIDKFRFRHRHYGHGIATEWIQLLDKWIGIALDNNVEEITIVNDCPNIPYLISERILYAPTVYSMKLVGGGLAPSSTYCDASINLKSLMSLVLLGFSIDDRMFGRLVNECKSLQFLSATHCTSLKKIRVSGPRNIKRVDLRPAPCTRLVEIEAPSLESFQFVWFPLVGSPSPMLNVNNSPNLRSLDLSMKGDLLTDQWFGDFLSRFPCLEDLKVHSYGTLTRIRILNPSVKRIVITYSSDLTHIELETPELTFLQLEAFSRKLPSIWTKNHTCHSCHVNLRIAYIETQTQDQVRQLREFLIRSCKFFSSLSLKVRTQETYFHLWRMDIKNKDRWLASVACNWRQLQQSPDLDTLSRKIENEIGVPAIDPANCSFILTCHPNTVALVAGLSGDGFLQFFFERIASRIQCHSRSCDTNGPESWPCQLKDMKIIQIVPGSNCEVPIGEHTVSATF